MVVSLEQLSPESGHDLEAQFASTLDDIKSLPEAPKQTVWSVDELEALFAMPAIGDDERNTSGITINPIENPELPKSTPNKEDMVSSIDAQLDAVIAMYQRKPQRRSLVSKATLAKEKVSNRAVALRPSRMLKAVKLAKANRADEMDAGVSKFSVTERVRITALKVQGAAYGGFINGLNKINQGYAAASEKHSKKWMLYAGLGAIACSAGFTAYKLGLDPSTAHDHINNLKGTGGASGAHHELINGSGSTHSSKQLLANPTPAAPSSHVGDVANSTPSIKHNTTIVAGTNAHTQHITETAPNTHTVDPNTATQKAPVHTSTAASPVTHPAGSTEMTAGTSPATDPSQAVAPNHAPAPAPGTGTATNPIESTAPTKAPAPAGAIPTPIGGETGVAPSGSHPVLGVTGSHPVATGGGASSAVTGGTSSAETGGINPGPITDAQNGAIGITPTGKGSLGGTEAIGGLGSAS